MIILPTATLNIENIAKTNKILSRMIGFELSKLSEPCYLPKIVKYWEDLKHLTGITENDIKLFYKGFANAYIGQFKVISNNFSSLLIISILYYSRKKEYETVRLLYYMLTIRFYSNLVHRNFKYCKPEVWDQSLETMSQKHLFKVKNGLSPALVYLSDVEVNRHYPRLSNENLSEKELLVLIYSLRHRISQSIRSFTTKYYEIEKQKTGSLGTTEGDEELDNIILVADKISSSICTYNQVDKVALMKSISLSNIPKDIGIHLIENLSSVEYKDNVKFLITLMNRIVPIKEWCFDSKRSTLVRKILNDKVKIKNYSIKKITQELGEELDTIGNSRSINKNQVISFILFYVSTYVKHRNCS